jgi:hypothetical protein
MRDFAFRHAAVVREDPDFRGDISRLIEQITRFVKQNTATTAIPIPYLKPDTLSGVQPATTEFSAPNHHEEPTTTALTREEVERQRATHAPPRQPDMRTASLPNLTMPPSHMPDPSIPSPVNVPAPNQPTFTPSQPPPTVTNESPRRSIDIRWVLVGIVILLLLAIILTLLASSP